MTKKINLKEKRIELRVPRMPRSLRGFIEKIIRDDRAFESLVESPVTALAAAGLPLKIDCFTGRDYVRLLMVLGNIRQYVKENKIDREIRFEDLFGITADDQFADKNSNQTWGTKNNFDMSNPSAYESQGSDSGVTEDFGREGSGRDGADRGGPEFSSGLNKVIMTVPLLNAADLAEILSRIDEGIEAKRGSIIK